MNDTRENTVQTPGDSRPRAVTPSPCRRSIGPRALAPLGFVCLLAIAPLVQPQTLSAKSYSVDGMIGQVNGRAIYTNAVLDKQLSETLARWGRELPRDTFRKRAAERIAIKLNSMVADALFYGEAKRDLSDQERQGLTSAQARFREQLLREYGQGSPALAEANLIKQTGLTLDQTIENWRQAGIVQRYINQKLRPKVNVTRKDIKRYYQDHYEEFNPPAKRTVRVIHTASRDDASDISAMLDRGVPFAQAANDDRNLFHRNTGGLMGTMAGNQLFADPGVNRAILGLEAGQCAGPISVGDKQWFVCVEKIEQPPRQSLMDVQTRIYATLKEQQLREQLKKYREKLFEKGSYNSIEQMTQSLLQIAMDRYTKTGG